MALDSRASARPFWYILLGTTIALMGMFLGLYKLIGLSDQTVYFILIPIGTGCLMILRMLLRKRRREPPGWLTAFSLLAVIAIVDLMLIIFAGFLLGANVYFVIFAHILAFLFGLIYFWLKLPRGPEPMMRR